jgi:hypothetical protein
MADITLGRKGIHAHMVWEEPWFRIRKELMMTEPRATLSFYGDLKGEDYGQVNAVEVMMSPDQLRGLRDAIDRFLERVVV